MVTGSMAVDNDFDTEHWNDALNQSNPWIQISLGQFYKIACIFWLTASGGAPFRTANMSFYVGNDPNTWNNACCVSGINNSGLYECNSPLNGAYFGARREGPSTEGFNCAELRAYEGLPFSLSVAMLSDTSGTVNSSLINALNFDPDLSPY